MLKTRYLPLNTVMMLEYKLQGESNRDIDFSNNETFYYTKLLDGHYLIFSPESCEVEFLNGKAIPYNIKSSDSRLKTLNTINHLGVPTNKKDTIWYTFIDNSYEYCEENELNSFKYKQYEPYLINPENSDSSTKIEEINVYSNMRYDSLKLYFVSGYDFSNMMGLLCRICIETKKPGHPMIDLCDFFINKSTYTTMVQYNSEPLIVGAQIYDRFIEIKLPCLTDICISNDNSSIGTPQINNILEIRENAPLHIVISSIEDGDFELKDSGSNTNIKTVIRGSYTNQNDKLNNLANCEFYLTSTLNGAIPTDELTSDRLGVYIAENKDLNCIEFCMTWRDATGKSTPLDFDTVSNFNHGIFLYDRSLIKEYSAYEIDDDYEVDDSVSIYNWVIMHNLRITYCDANGNSLPNVNVEEYSMSQTFINNEKPTIFYYKPLISDTEVLEATTHFNIEYTARLMNVRDMVQFVNSGSLSVTSNLNKYYINSVHTDYTDMVPFKIYNKIVENKHEVTKSVNIVPKIKYVKVFYDSTDIVLEGNSGTYYSSDTIVVQFSQAPKNYKFVLKNKKSDGVYDYMDLTEGYYKLYAKGANGQEIIIEPTYSSNMNMLLGELEFTLTKSILNILEAVSPEERKMSLIIQNEDNSISSLFDFLYEF